MGSGGISWGCCISGRMGALVGSGDISGGMGALVGSGIISGEWGH